MRVDIPGLYMFIITKRNYCVRIDELMKNILETLKKQSPSIEELINCFKQVRKNGDVAVIKLDGERSSNEYTVFISFPLAKKKEMIRADESDLEAAMIKVLTKYVEECK